MGVNIINEMMKNLVAVLGSSESSEKQFTNQNALKTVVSKLKKAKVERSGIVKITGHKNIQSLDDYGEVDEDEQRELSCAISARNNNPQVKIPLAREIHGHQLQVPHSSLIRLRFFNHCQRDCHSKKFRWPGHPHLL